MARAKTGGTSAKLRGVVGDYIYQIVRNPAGYSEQKVITYTREKLNRNTKYQCLARMQIAMFMRSMNLLTPIISDSFEGLRSRVNSCNRFVEINMPLIQDYCVQHWEDSILCRWPDKGREAFSFFNFYISEGSYKVPYQFSWFKGARDLGYPTFRFDLSRTQGRRYDMRKILGFNSGDSINFVYWSLDGIDVFIVNAQFNPQFNDYTLITNANCGQLFTLKITRLGDPSQNTYTANLSASYNASTKILQFKPFVQFTNEYGTFDLSVILFAYIFSKRKGNLWLRNTFRFRTNNPDDEEVDYGDPPMQAYYTWDEDYDGESYYDYFVR